MARFLYQACRLGRHEVYGRSKHEVNSGLVVVDPTLPIVFDLSHISLKLHCNMVT